MPRISATQRRQELIEAATRVVARDGVYATTTRSIATEAGAALTTLHYCFSSKEELLQEVLTDLIGDLALAAQHEIRVGQDATQTLSRSLRATMEAVVASRDEQLVTYEVTAYALRQPGMREMADTQYRVMQDSAEGIINAVGQASGVVWTAPVEMLGRLLLAALDGIVLHWLVDGDDTAAFAVLDSAAHWVGSFAAEPKAAKARATCG